MTLAAAHHAVPREPAWASLWLGFLLSVAPPVALVAFQLCQALGLAPQTDAGVAVACIIAAAISGLGAIRFVSGLRAARRVDRDRVTLAARQSEALEEAQASLAQARKMEALGRLTGGIAHDLNNLLQVITTDIGLVQYGMDIGDPDVRQYVDMAKRSVERAVSVTQRLLGFSRQQSPVRKEIETNRVVGEMADLLRHSFRDSMEIRTRFASGVGAVFADPVELETAILNLAVNSRDAMRQCGELTIETANASLDESYANAHAGVTPGQYVMISMSDTGIGMSHEVIARAFDPFFTTKEAGEGTGLGLAQVMGFVKHSGGHIEIESEQGIGTTVRLYLPRIVVTTGLADQEDTAERPTDASEGPDVTSHPFPPSKSGPSLNSRAGGM